MPLKIAGGMEAMPEINQEALEHGQELVMPIMEIAPVAPNDPAEALQQHINTDKFTAVSEHGGSLEAALQQVKSNPNTPLPRCVRNLGITSVNQLNQLAKRIEGTDDPAKRTPTIRELREAKKRETEKQVATIRAVEKPETTKNTEARPVSKMKRELHENPVEIVVPDKSVEQVLVSDQRNLARIVPDIVERDVNETEIIKPEPQAERSSLSEINNLAARERQQAEERQASLAQSELVEAVQARAMKGRSNVVEVQQRQFQPIDIVERTPDLLDVSQQINHVSAPIEVEQQHLENTGIESLETPALLEDFDIEGLDFGPHEESLHIDDTNLETGIIEEDESGVDELLADLEEGMQQLEAEYMGELLVAMFAGFTETESIEDVEDVDVHLSQAVPLEVAEEVLTISETATSQGFEKKFSLYLESLEPEQVEVTKNVIEELRDVLKESQQLPEETSGEERERTDQMLEELCIQLFESLGIEYDEEIIMQFIQSITAQESLSNANIESDKLSIDELNYLGTREYKPFGSSSLLGGLAQYIKQKMQSHLILGRYALHVLQPSF